MSSTDEDIAQMIADCENREAKLSTWGHDFIVSIKEQREAGRKLSPRQIEKLGEIWEEVTE